MTTISLCMIVKNEEEVLENCLSSVQATFDEIIIVDTGSVDRTKEIARNYTSKVYDFTWVDNFSAARNFSFSQATKDFIMWLDADDILKVEDLQRLLALKKDLSLNVDAVSMQYHIAFDERGNPTFSFRRNRIVKRTNQFKWHGFVHEYLEVSGHIISSDIAVTHNKHMKKTVQAADRNLKIYEQHIKKRTALTPRDLFYYANELRENGQISRAISYYNEFIATNKGWLEDIVRACLYLADCYHHLSDQEAELNALLNSFKYDEPRPQICCRLGDYFIEKESYKTAAYWFNCAIEAPLKDNGAFIEPTYSTFYPHLQLCVCYWHLGQMEKSFEHHKMTAKYRPTDSRVVFNNRIFAGYFQQDEHDKEVEG